MKGKIQLDGQTELVNQEIYVPEWTQKGNLMLTV